MNEIRYKIGADTSSLSRGLLVDAPNIAAKAGKAIERKLGMGDAFKSTVLALGLSIDKLAERFARFFTGMSEDAEKAFERLVSASDRTLAATRRMIQRDRSPEQNISALKNEEEALRRQLAELTDEKRRTVRVEKFDRRGNKIDPVDVVVGLTPEQQAQAKELEARIAELADQRDELDRQFTEAANRRADQFNEKQRKAHYESLGLEERIAAKTADREKVLEEAGKHVDMSEEQMELLNRAEDLRLEIAADYRQLQAENLKLLQEQTRENEKQTRETEKQQREEEQQASRREQFLEKYRRYLDAQDRVGDARRGTRDARHDAVAFGVGEAATGQRGNSRDRALARAILRDEQRARSLFDSGRTVTEFDSRTQRNVTRDSRFFQHRAEQMRAGFDKLRNDEQQPFKQVEKELVEANKHLKEMENSLKLTKTK
jgi:hypothetical protein